MSALIGAQSARNCANPGKRRSKRRCAAAPGASSWAATCPSASRTAASIVRIWAWKPSSRAAVMYGLNSSIICAPCGPRSNILKATGAAASASPTTTSASSAVRRAPASDERAPSPITPIPHQFIGISPGAQAAPRPLGRSGARAAARIARAVRDDVATRRAQLGVELELPEVPREGVAVGEVADVRLDRLAARHPHDELGIAPARARGVHRPREGAAEARVDVGDPEADLGIAEGLDGAGPAHAERLADGPAELDELLVVDDGPLDRLAAARLDHRARDRVEAAPVEVAEQVDRELRPAHEPLDHD